MTRALVLLDVENSPLRAVGTLEGFDEVVVASAVSLVAGKDHDVRRLEREAARAFPGARIRLELAVVPHVPEAADRALERLRDEAGSDATSGAFDELLVVSADKDVLDLTPSWMLRSRHSDRCVRAVSPGTRRHVRTVRRGGHTAEPGTWSPSSPTLPLDSAATIADLAHRGIEASPSLREVVARLEERPELLSLLSLTRGSSEGVARLEALLSGAAVTLAGATPSCDCEWPWADQTVPRGLPLVQPGPAGAGAVRLLWGADDGQRASSRLTRLPAWIVRECAQRAGRVPFRPGGMDDSGLLAAAGLLLDGPTAVLTFRPGATPRLLADGRESWWIGNRAQGRAATSKLALAPELLRGAGVTRLPRKEGKIAVRATIAHDRATFRADLDFRAKVGLPGPVAPGEIAWVDGARGRVLLWNPAGAPRLAQRSVLVAPIQYLSPDVVRSDRLDALLDLPCVVPVTLFHVSSFPSSVRSGPAPTSTSP